MNDDYLWDKSGEPDPEIQKLLITSGFEPVLDSGPEPAQQEVASEYARWTPIIKKLGFKVQ